MIEEVQDLLEDRSRELQEAEQSNTDLLREVQTMTNKFLVAQLKLAKRESHIEGLERALNNIRLHLDSVEL